MPKLMDKLEEVRGRVRTRAEEIKEKVTRGEAFANRPVRKVVERLQERAGTLAIIRPMGAAPTRTAPEIPVARRGVREIPSPRVTRPSIAGRVTNGGPDITKPIIGGSS